jgi:outer membrane receptor protein involved in Fe transport
MRKAMIIFMFAALIAGAAYAQETTGQIRGAVTDPDGAALPGVTLTIENALTGMDRTSITDAKGTFRFAALPPGDYSLTATLDGFQTHKSAIHVVLGGTHFIELGMALGAITDVIEVTGEAPLVDVSSTVSGITVGVDVLNARMPVQREANYVAMLAPATTAGDTAFNGRTPGQNNISVGGASVAENSYQVNGLNITNFRNGLGSTMVPMEFIEEIQVKTGGYEAEFGRSTGGVVNMVTKSGSNSLHGNFSLFYEPEDLQEQEPDTYGSPNQSEEREVFEGNASLGGAILKDKLFFFGFVRYTDTTATGISGRLEGATPDSGPGLSLARSQSDPYWGGKIDWNLTSNHRVEFTYITDDVTVDFEQKAFDLYDRQAFGPVTGAGYDERGGDNYIFKYTGIFTENFLLSAQYGQNDFKRSSYNAQDGPYAYDTRDGFSPGIGTWINGIVGPSSDERTAYRLDGDLYLGSHSLRGGLDYEENTSMENVAYAGGVRYGYYDRASSPTGYSVDVRHYSAYGDFDVSSNAMYVQDSWAVTPNLTFNLGVRYEKFENKNAEGDIFIETDNQWAPRLGLIWDPSGEGRSKVYASYGIYYLPIASNTNVRMAGYEVYDRVGYIWDGTMNPDGSPVGYVDCGAGGNCGNQGSVGDQIYGPIWYGDGTLVDPRATVASSFDPMSQNEIVLGYEHMVGDNWSFGVRGVMRDFNEVIEDFAIDAALYNRYGLCDPADWGCFEYRLGNPGSDFEGWYDIDGDGELDPVSFTAEELGFPKAERNYYALELTFKRRFADNWMLQGSYTWSHLYGNYEGYVRSDNGQDDAGITTNFDFPGLLDNSDGNLPQDRRHNLKIFGAYSWDSGLQVGGNVYYWSGRPINSFGVHPTDQFAALYGNESFFTNGVAMPRGCCGTTDDIFGIDAMVKYDFQVGNMDMNVRLDVFNLFDNDGVTEVNELGDTDIGEPNQDYGLPTHFQQPRRIRLGFGLNF